MGWKKRQSLTTGKEGNNHCQMLQCKSFSRDVHIFYIPQSQCRGSTWSISSQLSLVWAPSQREANARSNVLLWNTPNLYNYELTVEDVYLKATTATWLIRHEQPTEKELATCCQRGTDGRVMHWPGLVCSNLAKQIQIHYRIYTLVLDMDSWNHFLWSTVTSFY